MVRYCSSLPIFFASVLWTSNAIAGPCISADSDPDGDGYGFENGQSCTVTPGTTSAAPQAGACIDDDGDGWGWNGVASCQVQGNSAQSTSAQISTASAGACVDDDGDGWGWNGVASCRVSASSVSADTTSSNNVENNVSNATAPAPVTVQSPPPVSTAANCSVILSAGENIYSAVAGNNSKICLRPGNYFLPDQLALRSNQTLAGFNPSDPPRLNTSAVRTIVTTGQRNVILEDLVIDGNSSGAREFGILVGNGSINTRIDNVVVENTIGIGIGVTSSRTVNIIDSTVRNIGLDVRLRQAVWVAFGSSDVTIDGLTVRGREHDQAGGDHAVTCIDGFDGFTVTNSRSDFAGSGAVAANNCRDIVFTNNQLSNGREYGIDIVNGAIGAVISNNTITGFERAAMVFDDHDWICAGCGSNPTQIVVNNNTMRNNNRINLGSCKGIAVDSQMNINSTSGNWVRISDNNTVDADSALHCDHIH